MMKKRYSLKHHILLLLSGLLIGIMVICAISTVSAFLGQRQTQTMDSLIIAYHDYDDAVDRLQEAATNYYIDGTEANCDTLLQKAEELAGESKMLTALCRNTFRYSANPNTNLIEEANMAAFADLEALSAAYIQKAKTYVHDEEEVSIQEVEHMAQLTMIMHTMLQRNINSVMNISILQTQTRWRVQLVSIILVLAVLVAYAIYIVQHMLREMLEPIVRLTDRIRSYVPGTSSDKKDVRVFSSEYEELQILHYAYLDMTDTIDRQIVELEDKARIAEELRRKETALAGAELSLMQSLLTPHFLYNCMSTISSLATIERAPQTYRSAVMISQFLRSTLNNIGHYISVWEEVNYTQQYIEIQKLRFGDTIQFSINCNPSCAKVMIPAILLQPLIENAISHGVKHLSRGGEITVNIVMDGNFVILTVKDNGHGMPKEKLDQLRGMLESDYSPDNVGVGLRSVAYRLRDIYDRQATVLLDSDENGTKVTLCVPDVLPTGD